jgi:ABC-type Mn2+/Zn2+ transport system ATPase subunit
VLLGELQAIDGTAAVSERPGIVPQTERSRLDFPVSALDVALMGSLARLGWWRRPGQDERSRALDALETVGLRDAAQIRFGDLSGGQRQRVLIARALVQDARLVLLDEPFSGVDEPSVATLMSLIDQLAERGCSVMIATHDVEQVQAWDLVLCLNNKQIAFGRPEEVLTREVLEATYGGSIVLLPASRPDSLATQAILPPHHHDH